MTDSCPDPDTRCVKYEDSHEYNPSSLFCGWTMVNLFLVVVNVYFDDGDKTAPFFLHIMVVSLRKKTIKF